MIRLFLYILTRKKLAVTLAITCTAIIFIACLIPSYRVPRVNVPLMDKWVHFLVFAAFSFIWSCTLRKPSSFGLFMVFLSSVLTGYIVELVQGSGITTGRSFEWQDILADSIGGVLGVIIFSFLLRKAKAGEQ